MWVAEQAEARGQEMPAFLKNKPEFNDTLSFFWEAFWELSTTRHEMGQIPWTAINDYSIRWGIVSNEEFDRFVYFIRSMDSVFLGNRKSKLEKQRENKKSK